MCDHVPSPFVEGEETACRNQFSPSTKWVLEIEFRSSGLVRGTFLEPSFSASVFCFVSKTDSGSIAQAGAKLVILLPQSPVLI